MATEHIIQLALERTCPAGKPWTGDNPEEDHGHTDCWIYHQLINTIKELQTQNQQLASFLLSPYITVNETKTEELDKLLAPHIGQTTQCATDKEQSQ